VWNSRNRGPDRGGPAGRGISDDVLGLYLHGTHHSARASALGGAVHKVQIFRGDGPGVPAVPEVSAIQSRLTTGFTKSRRGRMLAGVRWTGSRPKIREGSGVKQAGHIIMIVVTGRL